MKHISAEDPTVSKSGARLKTNLLLTPTEYIKNRLNDASCNGANATDNPSIDVDGFEDEPTKPYTPVINWSETLPEEYSGGEG